MPWGVEREGEVAVEEAAGFDALNARLLDAVNATGTLFISHTKIGGTYALRLAIGNVRTQRSDVELAWSVLTERAAAL